MEYLGTRLGEGFKLEFELELELELGLGSVLVVFFFWGNQTDLLPH